ncbi:MAG: hypothetical protein IJX28_06330 [Clostridia bacterium]|nr:hypothetical protein [Clostridia bacterium]
MKKIIIGIILFSIVISCVSCSHDHDHDHATTTSGIITLSPDEITLIETVDELTNKVSKEEFVSFITSLQQDVSPYSGQIYMLQGYITTDYYADKTPFLYRTQTVEGMDVKFGLPLHGLTKVAKEGSEVRVLGIITLKTVNGAEIPVLDVLTIETILE